MLPGVPLSKRSHFLVLFAIAAGCRSGDPGIITPSETSCIPDDVCPDGDCAIETHPVPLTVSGTLMVDGHAPQSWWHLEPDNLEEGLVGYSHNQFDARTAEYEARFAPGVYDLNWVYRDENDKYKGSFPVQTEYLVTADATLNLNVATARVSGAVRVDGEPPDWESGWTLRFMGPDGHTINENLPEGVNAYATDVPLGSWRVYVNAGVQTIDLGDITLTDDLVLDLDVQRSRVSGEMTYDGVSVAELEGAWEMKFINTDLDAISVGYRLHSEEPLYEVLVPPGTYDVYFRLLDDDAVARPVSGTTPIATAVDIGADIELDIAVETVELSGELSWNGQSIGDPDDWRLALSSELADFTLFTVGEHSAGSSYTAWVYPGVYDVALEVLQEQAVDGWVEQPAEIAAGVEIVADTHLDLAVSTASLSGSLRYEGAVDDQIIWQIAFWDEASGDYQTVSIDTGATTYHISVHPGTYDIWVSPYRLGAEDPPPEGWTVQAVGQVLEGHTTLDIDVETVPLELQLTYDGAPLPPTDRQESWLVFVSRQNRNAISWSKILGDGSDAFSLRAFPGVYDVYFQVVGLDAVDRPADGAFPVRECAAVH